MRPLPWFCRFCTSATISSFFDTLRACASATPPLAVILSTVSWAAA